MKHWTWAGFMSKFAQDPLGALTQFGQVLFDNAIHNWWRVLLAIVLFWLARFIIFSILDIAIPRSLSEKPPRWATNKLLLAWRDKLRRETLETRSLQRSRAAVSLTKSLVDPIMGFVAFLTIFSQLGMSMTSQTGSIILGGFSIAVGLGFQGVITDAIAGVTILFTDTFAVGDYIDAQFGVSGVVRHIGVRFTTLEASDGTIWSVRHSEIPKVGNLTATEAVIVSDVIFTWNEEDKHVGEEELKFAETTLDETVKNLAQSLKKMDRMAHGSALHPADGEAAIEIASVVPTLVPSMGADTLYDMRAITEHDKAQTVLKETVPLIPGRIPLFTVIENHGFVESTADSITLRVRIVLPPKSSRNQAMSALRRAIFDEVAKHDISVKFRTVPEDELPSI